MKAITLWQPWATLVAIGAKRVETRSWQTSYRGPLAIHSAKNVPLDAKEFSIGVECYEAITKFSTKADRDRFLSGGLAYPLGMVLATCNLVACLPMESEICLPGVFEDYPELDTPRERSFGDFSEGRWAWILEDVQRLSMPIPARGAQRVWNWRGPENDKVCTSEPTRDATQHLVQSSGSTKGEGL